MADENKESNVESAEELRESFGKQDQKLAENDAEFIEIDLFRQRTQSEIDELKTLLEESRGASQQMWQAFSALQALAQSNERNIDAVSGALAGSHGVGNIVVRHDADGSLEIVDYEYIKPFDITLIDLTTKTISVKNNEALSGGIWLAGVVVTTITEGGATGMTEVLDGADIVSWITDAMTAESWIYLIVDKTNATVSINMSTALPTGTSSLETIPLWYIPWDSTPDNMAISNIVDLRGAFHIMGFA